MKRFPRRSIPGLVLLGVLVIFLLAACSTMPPPTPAYDVKSISGKWTGTVEAQRYARFYIEMTIRPEGTWEMKSSTKVWLGRTMINGTLYIEDDVYRFVSDITEFCGTLTLYSLKEGRTLRLETTDGATRAHLTQIYK